MKESDYCDECTAEHFGTICDHSWWSPSTEPYVHIVPTKEALHNERVASYKFAIKQRLDEIKRFQEFAEWYLKDYNRMINAISSNEKEIQDLETQLREIEAPTALRSKT